MSETALVTGVVTSRICAENPVAGVVPFKVSVSGRLIRLLKCQLFLR